MPPTRRPTMTDVAEAAGVSLKTVSRVVNREEHVAPETVERVERAIAELGYGVDDRARRLRQKGAPTSRTIGFVLVDVANDFFSAMLRGLEDVTQPAGVFVLSGSTDSDKQREFELLEAFASRRVDGLVVVTSTIDDGPLATELRRRTPVVIVDLEPPELVVDVVRTDHREGGRIAARHLLEHGHRDIAFWGDRARVFSADQRFEGFVEVLTEHGVELPPHRIVRYEGDGDDWLRIADEQLAGDDHPTAIFSAQNFVTLGLVPALHRHGLADEIAVVAHDDVQLATVVDPPLTVAMQHPREIGRRAGRQLLRRMDGDDSPPVLDLVPAELVVRGSGEIPGPHLIESVAAHGG